MLIQNYWRPNLFWSFPFESPFVRCSSLIYRSPLTVKHLPVCKTLPVLPNADDRLLGIEICFIVGFDCWLYRWLGTALLKTVFCGTVTISCKNLLLWLRVARCWTKRWGTMSSHISSWCSRRSWSTQASIFRSYSIDITCLSYESVDFFTILLIGRQFLSSKSPLIGPRYVQIAGLERVHPTGSGWHPWTPQSSFHKVLLVIYDINISGYFGDCVTLFL